MPSMLFAWRTDHEVPSRGRWPPPAARVRHHARAGWRCSRVRAGHGPDPCARRIGPTRHGQSTSTRSATFTCAATKTVRSSEPAGRARARRTVQTSPRRRCCSPARATPPRLPRACAPGARGLAQDAAGRAGRRAPPPSPTASRTAKGPRKAPQAFPTGPGLPHAVGRAAHTGPAPRPRREGTVEGEAEAAAERATGARRRLGPWAGVARVAVGIGSASGGEGDDHGPAAGFDRQVEESATDGGAGTSRTRGAHGQGLHAVGMNLSAASPSRSRRRGL